MMSKSNRGDDSGRASSQQISGMLPRCRTCRNCRQKKVKCDGRYPQCSACDLRGVECMYPRDARRSAVRTKRVDVKDLERQIEELKKQIQETPNRSQAVADVTLGEDTPNVQYAPDLRHRNLLSPQDDQSPSPAQPQFESTPRVSGGHSRIAGSARTTASDSRIDTHVAAGGSELPEQAEHEHEQSPDPIIADGNIQVYGATSLLHDQSSRTPLANQLAQSEGQHEVATEIIKARLISNAALRRQEELKLIYTPSIGTNMDFDGVPMDLALHLLNLHWNRSHLSYLISYRPAVMDSLFNNGPYINKLLLNAIYLQSSLYNDRSLPPGLQHPKNNGLVFYERFKLLLPQYLDAPVLPTVVALLTCGACLVPYGKQSAGWALCGMAYQMIIDLGCHLELSSYEGERTGTSTMLEQEMKKRIYWGAFVSDKFQSLFLGRPPMMHEDIGNISCNYLDSFEEMEEWRPYYDPISQPIEESVPAYFRGTPSYAVSTFQSLLRLCKIATEIINAFYATNSAKSSESTLLQTRDSVLEQIDQWHQTLSPWLRFDPAMGTILAPHQITPHTLHWTLIILTEQAFLNRGHFGFTLEPQMEEIARQRCIQAALNIWKLVDVYRKTFTLRRAQYGISYATYCAVLVLLQHTRHDNQEYNECIRFFWTALWEYQKGCNQGLIRPLHLLRSLMRRLKRTMEDLDAEEGNVAAQSLLTEGESTTNMPFIDSHSDLDLNNWDCSWLNSLTDDGLMSGDLVFGFFA